MLTYELIGRVVLLIIIFFKCLLQQQTATKVTLQVLIALRHPSYSPPQEDMHVCLLGIQEATA